MSISTAINARTMSAAEFLASMRGMEGGSGLAPRRAFYDRYAAFARSMGYRYTYELVAWLEINEPDVAAAVSFIGDLDDEFYDGVADLFEELPDDIAKQDNEALRIVRAAWAVRSEMLGRAARGEVEPADALTPHAAALAVTDEAVEAVEVMQALELLSIADSCGAPAAELRALLGLGVELDEVAEAWELTTERYSVELFAELVGLGVFAGDMSGVVSMTNGDVWIRQASSRAEFAQEYMEEWEDLEGRSLPAWAERAIDWDAVWQQTLRHEWLEVEACGQRYYVQNI